MHNRLPTYSDTGSHRRHRPRIQRSVCKVDSGRSVHQAHRARHWIDRTGRCARRWIRHRARAPAHTQGPDCAVQAARIHRLLFAGGSLHLRRPVLDSCD